MTTERTTKPATSRFVPERLEGLEASGLRAEFVSDLVLKTIYVYTTITPREMMGILKLPFAGVIEPALKRLVDLELAFIRGGLGPLIYEYALTENGPLRAREVMARSPYVGPAPVTLADYRRAVQSDTVRRLIVQREDLERAFAHLIIEPSMLDRLGPAINSGQSIFLFGPSGNGKTVIAEAIMHMLSGHVWVPHAVLAGNDVISVYDPNFHQAQMGSDNGDPLRYDARWVQSRRPIVEVGGELTLAGLDLSWSEEGKYYQAPFQMRANGGAFLIDDFGRQLVSPRELLNRWIVPLEKRVDYLTLRTGTKVEVPFDELILFSTNIDPKELVDEAFLRRIRFKVPVDNPTPDQFRRIFATLCERARIPYNDQAVCYLLNTVYPRLGVSPRSVHPRDLIEQIYAAALFEGTPPVISPDTLDRASQRYFVTL
ncbi:MAG TPA: ATP-binding protein [Dehalococcoidia bacterium]|nr:ATP-binding protein [Dehalococcoidia bacterium]